MKKRIARAFQNRDRLLFVAICVSVSVGAFAVQALGSFGKPRGFAVGSYPDAIAIGRFNGDGKRDIAVANLTSRNVSILLGRGDGTFGKAKSFAVDSGPNSIAIGRFNSDGKRDIAVAGGAGVSILLGRGDGTFGKAKSFAAGSAPNSIAVGDFNRDGKRDIAVAGGASVSILLGHGDGSFGPARSYPGGVDPQSVVVGKFNADTNLDIAVANVGPIDCEGRIGRAQASSCVGGFGNVSILLGHGDGSFGPPAVFPVGDATQPVAMVVGNFNADTKPDLALVDYFQYANCVSVLLGRGDGTFGKAKNFAAGSSPNSIAIGDINQDSHDDLAVTSSDYPKSVSVLLGRGNGTFGAATDFPTGASGFGSPAAVAVGNLNAGSSPDLAVAIRSSGSGARNRVAVLLNSRASRR